MQRKITIPALGCLALSILVATAIAFQPFHREAWLTSSFSENRGVRYHAGIDYATLGQEGWPVYAPEAGQVSEVRFGPFFYGKAVFFHGKSGKTWVFAHLSGFANPIDSLVWAKRFKAHINQGSLSFRKDNGPPFDSGAVLAYSGSTGIGDPHLHLEIRDSSGAHVLSPCQNGLECPDTIAPSLFEAATWDAKGKGNDLQTSAQGLSQGLSQGCVALDPKNAEPKMALKIADYSRLPADNPMSILSLKLVCGEKTVFAREYRQQTYGRMARIREELLWSEEVDTAGDWHMLSKGSEANGNVLHSQSLAPCGKTDNRIEVTDFSGNQTRQSFRFQASCPGAMPPLRKKQQGPVFTYLARTWVDLSLCGSNAQFWLQDSSRKNLVDLCKTQEHQAQNLGPLLAKSPQARVLRIAGTSKEREFLVGLVEGGKQLNSIMPFFEINYTPAPTQGPVAYAIGSWDGSDLPPYTAGPNGFAYELHPKGLHIQGNVKVCLASGATLEPYWLAESSRKWNRFSNWNRNQVGYACVQMDELRDLRLLKDQTPPLADSAHWGTAAIQGQATKVLRIRFSEVGSGIPNGNAIQAWQDSTWVPNEYDAEQGFVQIEPRHLKPNQYIKLHAEDEAGNKKEYLIPYPQESTP